MSRHGQEISRSMAVISALLLSAGVAQAKGETGGPANVAVGAQYDTTHVYIAVNDFDVFVNAFTATFGGKPSPRGTFNVLPVPSNTQGQYVWTPVGTLSTFAFLTPIPYPFGQERTGYLVTDMDAALAAARAAGAEVVVDKFKDPIGYDAVIQWPGGVKMQLYWHFTAPSYGSLETIPDNRIYISREAADTFVRDFLKFSHGKIVSDDKHADAGEVGKPGEKYRRIRIESRFGKMQVMVTDGHLPYPFGHEISGYEVKDLDATLAKAASTGAKVLAPRFDASDRSTAVVEFPGGYIAEIHVVHSGH
jgi:predicted enzyme related to lactoylglutathione lyase